jgi:hypothetical protein
VKPFSKSSPSTLRRCLSLALTAICLLAAALTTSATTWPTCGATATASPTYYWEDGHNNFVYINQSPENEAINWVSFMGIWSADGYIGRVVNHDLQSNNNVGAENFDLCAQTCTESCVPAGCPSVADYAAMTSCIQCCYYNPYGNSLGSPSATYTEGSVYTVSGNCATYSGVLTLTQTSYVSSQCS